MKIALRVLAVILLAAAGWVIIQNRRAADLNNRAVRLLSEERYEEALPFLEKARLRAPRNVQVLKNLARTYDQLDMEEKALGVYQALLRRLPGYPDAQRRVEEIQQEIDMRSRAARRVERMKAEGHRDGEETLDWTLKMADTYFHAGDFEQAVLFYERALFKDPGNTDIKRKIEALENRNRFIENTREREP